MGMHNATKEEIWEIENLAKIVLIYDLMMKRVIEENGCWRHDGPPASEEELLKCLAERICRMSDYKPDQVYATLRDTVQQGSLQCVTQDGKIKWQWEDYIGMTNVD